MHAVLPVWFINSAEVLTAEVLRASERGTAFVALTDNAVQGFACHSVSRTAWFGPMATFPAGRGRGLGSALLATCLSDLNRLGHETAQINWVGPIAFYVKVANASAGRLFLNYKRALGNSDYV